jgi:DNA (cytosine-5)-methyltransferase 1
MSRPRLLDLFCGAGGCSVGYARAGFEVVGVEINPQPHYPFEFIQADAVAVLPKWIRTAGFDAIHASPPCQFATDYKRAGNVKESPNLIPQTRELLEQTGLPYVIENVEKAGPELRDPVLLCGSMFDGRGMRDVQRHRLFETNWPLEPPALPCRHKIWAPDRFPGGRSKERTGSSRGLVRATMEIGSWDIPLATQQEGMGIDWMNRDELSEAIPPAYTELIGAQLMQHLKQQAVA